MRDCEYCETPLFQRSNERDAAFRKRRFCDRECIGLASRKPINHGTVSGYNTHLRRGEKPSEMCPVCHEARLTWQRNRYPDVKATSRPQIQARRRARQQLVASHYEEYQLLLKREYEKLEEAS